MEYQRLGYVQPIAEPGSFQRATEKRPDCCKLRLIVYAEWYADFAPSQS
jgi:hypothetical protein